MSWLTPRSNAAPTGWAGRLFLGKGAAEVGEALVADFERGFGNVAAAGGDATPSEVGLLRPTGSAC
jgi:hypothetical protein